MQGQPAAQRRQSVARAPPVPPAGMPVRAPPQGFIQPAYKQSLPPAPKSAQPDHRAQPSTCRTYASSHSSGSSYDTFSHPYTAGGGLRESTRVNIKGSAPPISPRQVSATLAWPNEWTSPKEPDLVTPKSQFSAQVDVRDPVDSQFENLLDSLQVSEAVREKFHTVSYDVKSSILHSSMTSNPTILFSLGLPLPPPPPPKMRKKLSTPLLRKAKSSSELESPNSSPQVGKTYAVNGEGFTIVASPGARHSPAFPNSPVTMRTSVDMPRPSRRSTAPRPSSFFGPSGSDRSMGRQGGKGLGIAMGEQPDAFVDWLRMYKGTDLRMEVGRCKKLRMLLRHESTDWVREFVDLGGYSLILARLQDLLDVEWREEQHDDQMLYELLRCIKALSTSEIGKNALRSAFPKPFPALSSLLFSEKKPGDIPARQIIVEMCLYLFDLFPTQLRPTGRPTSVRFEQAPIPPVDVCEVVRGLLQPDVPDPTQDQHAFITQSHRPRVFKAWIAELSDICRDYFWIMCHASNTLWNVEEVDERLVEKPVAPGGATGGVEFEAMNYATYHFRLLNALAKNLALQDPEKARALHHDLMQSGMDRILVTLRKASTTYYPSLHLELARYVQHLRTSSPSGNGRLPHLIDKMVGPPPEGFRLRNFGIGWDVPSTGGGGGPNGRSQTSQGMYGGTGR